MSDTSTALTPQQSFQENIKNKLRDDIGGLIPDDVLSELVKTSLNEMFFTRKEKNEGSQHHPRMVLQPSWFDEEVQKLLDQGIKDAMNAAIKERMPEIEAAVRETFVKLLPQLMVSFFMKQIRMVAGDEVMNNNCRIEDFVRQEFQNRGFSS